MAISSLLYFIFVSQNGKADARKFYQTKTLFG